MVFRLKNRRRFSFIILLLVVLSLCGCAGKKDGTDYSDRANWVYLETEQTGKQADVFFICPTVYGGDENSCNMSLEDEKTKASFLGATNMEKGIYDSECRFFAPYYRQAGLMVYTLPMEQRESSLSLAYTDVKASFEYYLDHYNQGRPVVLAGFSQGADMCIRVLKDCFAEKKIQDRLVACYAIGWNITEEEMKEYPHLKFAAGETDTGVIISFNSESEVIQDSLMIPSGTRTLAINPLNWKTDHTPADRSLNKGACFTDYDGKIKKEIPNLTGAYIDDERGALKVTDVTPEEYPPVLNLFEDGIYHLYDYQFFYRNLQENVTARVETFISHRE